MTPADMQGYFRLVGKISLPDKTDRTDNKNEKKTQERI